MKLTAVRLSLCTLALCAVDTALADDDWTANVGAPQPQHYFGDVRAYLGLAQSTLRAAALSA